MNTRRAGKNAFGVCLVVLSIGILGFTVLAGYEMIADIINDKGVGTKDPVLAVLLLAVGLLLLRGGIRTIRRSRELTPV